MKVLILNVKADLLKNENEVFSKALKVSGIRKNTVKNMYVYKKSVDARKGDIKFIYSVCAELKGNYHIAENANVKILKEFEYDLSRKKVSENLRPVIIGAGPSGLFCAYLLVMAGLKPIVFERGGKIEDRIKDVNSFFEKRQLNPACNIQFGEGGAGTFSDGKLTTGINDFRCDYIIKTFAEFGAPKEILTDGKPHIGTDYLRKVIVNMRKKIEELGGEFHFYTKVDKLVFSENKVEKIILENGEGYSCEAVVLATGHSARDTYEMLYKNNVPMEKKPFSVGFRVEHLREDINKMRYHEFYNHEKLKAADYKLSYRNKERGCYSFCMCPGGLVVPSQSEENTVVVNGMSNFKRDEINSNSAIVASVFPSDTEGGVLGGMYFQRELEKKAFDKAGGDYSAPVQLLKDFLNGEKTTSLSKVMPSYCLGYNFADLNDVLPGFVTDIIREGFSDFDKKMKGFADSGAVITGVETRTSAPVRVLRNEAMVSQKASNLYPCGEGAGYAGGIMSAAADGLKVAEKILGI
ncbi:MAG: NAD(P)/FAD-dependent oxidoreductase [Clostridia bacterium]|nr:NAD(P)/FAD-dependent oxidoreductase [Clostridia bacterium]